jgi:hypothetical protein
MRRPETEVDMATIEGATEVRPFSVDIGLPQAHLLNEVDEGNHFAALQEPELFTQELRAAFRPLRTNNNQGRSS